MVSVNLIANCSVVLNIPTTPYPFCQVALNRSKPTSCKLLQQMTPCLYIISFTRGEVCAFSSISLPSLLFNLLLLANRHHMYYIIMSHWDSIMHSLTIKHINATKGHCINSSNPLSAIDIDSWTIQCCLQTTWLLHVLM